jgi:transposase
MRRYIARRNWRIAASVGTLVIHSRPYQPEGRGKVERCFRTVREQFLANLDPKRALSLDELNERLWAWIDNMQAKAEELGIKGSL